MQTKQTKTNRHLVVLAVACFVTGAAIFYYKCSVLGFPLLPDTQTQVWSVEATLNFRASSRPIPVKVLLQIPEERPKGFSILSENAYSGGFGLTKQDNADGREARWTVRRATGPQTLYYRAVVYRDRDSKGRDDFVLPASVPVLDEPFSSALETITSQARDRSADIETFTSQLLARLNDPSPDEDIALFLPDTQDDLNRAAIAKTLLAGARIPARVIHVIHLQDQVRSAPLIPWLEVYTGDRWLYFNPNTGEKGLPSDHLIWWRGDTPLVDVEGGYRMDVGIAVNRNVRDTLEITERRAEQLESRSFEFSLFTLPISTQAVYGVLLLIPVGALVMVILRNVVGVRTFGTFMPVLIALAFRETQLLSGIFLFVILVTLGLSIRFYLERLRLLLVPRLTSVLVAVVLLMLCVSVVSHKLGLDVGLSVALFPMVIITMVIERMSVMWEERGPADAIKEGAGSIAVAAVAFLVMSMDVVEHLMFVFPELMLVILAATLVLGRYKGYRLLELVRFKALAGTSKS